VIVAIHQPVFLPWLGFFYKMLRSDIFVILDTAQYSKNSLGNRNIIKTSEGIEMVTVPILTKGRFRQRFNETKINNTVLWRRKHLRAFEMNYQKAKYFEVIFSRLKSIYHEREWDNLCMFNMCLFKWVKATLGLQTELIRASSLRASGTGVPRLIEIVEELGANIYLSGLGGKKYQQVDDFKKANIELRYYDFSHPEYSQLWGEFAPNCSVIDLLFNCGPQSKAVLGGLRSTDKVKLGSLMEKLEGNELY